MREITTGMASLLEEDATTFATCVLLKLTDGTLYGFTSHSQDLSIGIDSVVTVYSSLAGALPTTAETTAHAQVDNITIDSVLNSSVLSQRDMLTGRFDAAEVTVFLVDYTDLTKGVIYIHNGILGDMTFSNNGLKAESLSLMEYAIQQERPLTSPICRVKALGDSECKIDLTPFTFNLTVTEVVSRKSFKVDPTPLSVGALVDGYFSYGTVSMTSGDNINTVREVKQWVASTTTFILQRDEPYTIVVGDTLRAIAGCDRRPETCTQKFNNIINIRAEPSIPGFDTLTRFPGAP